ncbi:hypothetical protein Tco_1385847 [Tanacetum coccineum]
MKAALRFLRSLKGSPGLWIQFDKVSDQKLRVFSDADWAKCPKTIKSVTGYIEVEYRSMAFATCETIWFGNILREKSSNGSSGENLTFSLDGATVQDKRSLEVSSRAQSVKVTSGYVKWMCQAKEDNRNKVQETSKVACFTIICVHTLLPGVID